MKYLPLHTRPTLLTSATLLGLSASSLLGAGFQLAERSVSGLGRAFSGEAAIADDASVMASNAAGMILLDDGAISVGLQYINPEVDVAGFAPGPTPARDSDIADSAVVPYFYYSRKINDDLSVGVGVYSSFGLATGYSKEFASLAGTETSEITTASFNPSLAYRLNEKWTIGVGVTAMYVEGRLTALDTASDPSPGPVGSTLFDLEGDDWGYGWNLGFLYELSEHTRIGFQYRSSVDLEIKGTTTGNVVMGATVPTTLSVELPDIAELSVYHEINEQWAVHGDVVWTGWSKFKELAPITGTAVDPSLAVQENWEDSFRYSIGATYKHSDKVTYRIGFALDESPVPSIAERTLRIPDGDRVWASIGATIKLNECYNLDIAYTHIFADDTDIQFSALGGNEGQFGGKAGGDVDIFGVGISGTF